MVTVDKEPPVQDCGTAPRSPKVMWFFKTSIPFLSRHLLSTKPLSSPGLQIGEGLDGRGGRGQRKQRELAEVSSLHTQASEVLPPSCWLSQVAARPPIPLLPELNAGPPQRKSLFWHRLVLPQGLGQIPALQSPHTTHLQFTS